MRTMKQVLAVILSAGLLLAAAGCGTDTAGKTNGAAGAEITGTQAAGADVADGSAAGADMADGSAAGGAAEGNAAAGDSAAGDAGTAVSSTGRYMDSTFSLPEGADYLARATRIQEDGTWLYFDPSIGLYASKDEAQSWQQVKSADEIMDGEQRYVAKSAVAPDGSIAMCAMEYGEEEVTGDVLYVGADKSRRKAACTFSDGDYISRLYFAPDGVLYATSIRGKVCEFDTETESLKQIFTAAEGPEVLAFSDRLLLTLENDRVEIYDRESESLQEADPVLDAFCREYLYGSLGVNSGSVEADLIGEKDGVVYLVCRKGIFRHVLGGNAMEQLVNGSFSALGDPTVAMCAAHLLESGEFLLITTKESGIRMTYDPEEPTIPENLLKVYSLRESSRIRQIISAYQKNTPDVYVVYETGIPDNSAVTLTDALKTLNLELLGGNGPDVLLLDGIDMVPYVEKGMLRDLTGLYGEVLAENKLFEKIAGTYKQEDGLFVIPAAFQLPLILGKTEDVAQIKDLQSLADFAVSKGKLPENCNVTGAMTPLRELRQLLAVNSPAWMENRSLKTEAIAEFLTQAKRLYEADVASMTREFMEGMSNDGGMPAFSDSAMFQMMEISQVSFGTAKNIMMDGGDIAYFTEQKQGYSYDLFSGQAGTGFVPVNKFAVAANTQQPRQAEEFVKLALSTQIQDTDMYDGLPVNRDSFDGLCDYEKEENRMSFGMSYKKPDGTESVINTEFPKPETTDRLKELAGQVQNCLEGNPVLEEAVLKYGVEVLTGTMDVDTCIAKIEKELSIYLAE